MSHHYGQDAVASLEAGAVEVIPPDGLRAKLGIASRENRPLIVKLGFDPTAPDLHLGHAVVLKKLRDFQRRGHQIVVIIGEFTARIGDPTGKNKARPPLSREQVAENASTYLRQLSLILDVDRLAVRSNAEWFDTLTVRDMIDLLAQFTVAQIMEREDFSRRYREGVPISLHELVYPLLQGYDSYVIESDVELGGMDQLLNCLVGRHVQEAKGVPAQAVVCMRLLRGTDGQDKMSKSVGNYVGLTDSPIDMYGKLMSIPDELLPEYIDLTTDLSLEEREALKARLGQGAENPMAIKKAVAFDVVCQYHSEHAAEAAAEHFYRQVQKKEPAAEDYVQVTLGTLSLPKPPVTLVDLGAAIARRSKSEIRRLIHDGAVSVNGERVDDAGYTFESVQPGTKVRIGKRGYYEIIAG
jgi:tyrosyl-tRNA synthetase